MRRSFVAMVVALVVSLPGAGSASADVTYWQTGTANWSEPTAWSDGEPTLFHDAEIDNGGTATIDQNGEHAQRLLLGISSGGSGNVAQGAGSAFIDSIQVAFGEGTHGEYRFSDGSLNAEELIVGQAGVGNFVHTDGQNHSSMLIIGSAATGQGTYQLAGGLINAADEHIGRSGIGVLTQTSGTNMVSGDLTLGGNATYPGGSGTYNLLYGELQLKQTASVLLAAHNGTATFRLGDQWETGTIREIFGDGEAGVNLTVRESQSGTATFVGWGTVPLTGVLNNNGRVVADGYGTDRTLDLSTFSSITNDLDVVQSDGSLAGWYAQGGGKLTLPSVEIEIGSNSYNWGEDADDASLDLVNSVRMDLTGVTSGGDLSIDLLDGDRAEVPNTDDLLLLGVWDFSPPAGFGAQAVDLTFRYDDVRATELGLNEPDVYAYSTSSKSWGIVTDARDPAGHTVSTNDVGSLSYYAVGSYLQVLNSSDSGLWHQAATWDRPSMTPGAEHRVTIGGHAVTVDQNAAAFSLEIAGGGSLAVDAGKTLSVGANVAVGSDGTMAVNGTLTAAQVTSDGLLSGSGTIHADEIAIGGAVSPGNAAASIGTITVGGGELTLDGIYRVQVSLAEETAGADRIEVATGSLELGGTLAVAGIDRTSNAWSAEVSRKIVGSSTGAITGAGFEAVIPASGAGANSHIGQGAFLQEVNITPTAVELDLFVALGGDVDGDGKVWLSDWAALRANFGNSGSGLGWKDANFDPWVDDKVWLSDWAALRANFGNRGYTVMEGDAEISYETSHVAVPEPGTLALLLGGLGGLALLIWRQRYLRCRK